MVNTINNSNSTMDTTLEQRWDSMTKAWLYQELADYYNQNTTDSLQKAAKLQSFILKKDLESSATTPTIYQKIEEKIKKDLTDMENEHKKKLDEANKQGKSKKDLAKLGEDYQKERFELMENYFKSDIQSELGKNQASLESLRTEKDTEINRLKDQLTGILTEWGPSLKEYFSINRRRLLTINANIQKMKADTENYPKNVLVYLMSLMWTRVFWMRKSIKKFWIKRTWNSRAENLNDQFALFDEWTQDEAGDSQWEIALKQILRTELADAKKAYVSKVSDWAGV